MEKRLFTSESVTEGHPDKMCDQISDAILDALIAQDPMSRVACETCTTTGLVMVMGEITTNAYVDIQKIVRDTVREIGYTRGKYGFDALPGYKDDTNFINNAANFWVGESTTRAMIISCWEQSTYIIYAARPEFAYSIRCIKDSE